MSHINSNLISCPQLQEDLTTQFTTCIPQNRRELLGFWEFLMSPTNRSGMLQNQISPGDGKRRDVELLYTPRILESEVNTNVSTPVCASSNEAGQLSETYNIGCEENVEYNELFDLCNLSDICKDNGMWFAERVQAIMDVLLRRADTEIMDQAVPLVGGFAVGDVNVVGDLKTVQTQKANGDPDTNMVEEIFFTALNSRYCSIPYVIGYTEPIHYYNRFLASCCADSGLDLGVMSRNNRSVLLADHRVEDSFDNNHFLTMAAGALQILTFNKFQGKNMINQIDTEHYKQTILLDPATGTPFDFVYKNDCGTITISLSLTFKLVALPNDLYSVGDRFEGVTQVNEWVIVNP